MADLQRAIEIAVDAHRGQVQKNGLPYVLHPLTLMFAVTSPAAMIVAVLHDVVEDTEWTLEAIRAEGFGPDILEAVDCLTHRAGERYEAYIDRISGNPIARAVKRADLVDNMNVRRLASLSEKDLRRLEKYHRAWQQLERTDP